MFHFFKKKPTLHIPSLNGEKTETSEVASLRTKERIFMIWAIAAIILLITTACIGGFFYLKNYFFKLGIKTGEKASYGRLYTSITEAGCRPIDINAPEGSIKGEKVSVLNVTCNNDVFKLGVETGEKASNTLLYTSIIEAACNPIDISAPEGSIKGEKVSVLNVTCNNDVFKLGVETGEKASYGRLYTSITEAGCRPIDISAPEGSIKGDKISLLNMACFMQPQRSSSGTMMRNAR